VNYAKNFEDQVTEYPVTRRLRPGILLISHIKIMRII